ncbi:tRNA lysidine(34) synthetase TilS [Massilia phyllosphaerae]|uniref:tRNA lysidine(34) synthetase TilS n=1 Tax=Massilia phyllosphaerae TaxID=3106034 RepID=UPI002B1CC45D|nr:tRNA lysidine(34) synthetase TilS [Massilia sp. SGZ-792]
MMQIGKAAGRGRPAAAGISSLFAQALAGLRSEYFPSTAPAIAVALSGGLDSMVLLRLAHAYAREHGLSLSAFHVHHGLSPNADAWRAHCAAACAALGIGFDAREVSVEKGKSGIEAAARKARYAALGTMCRAHGVDLLLTAHHLDDQAETVLLQLLRGSGPAGLSGMDAANRTPALLGDAHLLMARPLLQAARADLEALAKEEGIDWVEDESNSDPRYARNALRHTVMPALGAAFPGFQARVARSSMHAQSALRVLLEVAGQDLERCLDGDAIDLAQLRALSPDRINNVLRHWFSVRRLAMPSTAWMDEMIGQLFSAREDAQMLVVHPECHVRRHRERLYLVPKLPDLAGMRDPDDEGIIDKHAQAFRWAGEASLAFPHYGGILHFDAAETGFDPDWLRAQPLAIDFRNGGERLKLAPNRPSRSLKAHFQAGGVPAWERTRLPIVSSGIDLLYAAGLGMDCHYLQQGAGRVALRWETGD